MKYLAALLLLPLSLLASNVHATPIAYGTTGSGGALSDLYSVDVMTGTTTFIGGTGIAFNALAYHNGVLYGSQRLGGSLYSIDTSSGAATAIGALGTNITSMAISAGGIAIGWSESGDDPYSINLATGAATLLGSGISSASHGLAFDGETLYFHNYDGNVYTVDTGTGATSFIGNSGIGRNAIDGDINVEDGLYYGLGNPNFGGSGINVIDLPTATFIGNTATDVQLHTLTFANAAVPAPQTLALLGIALVGLGFCRRKARA